MLPVQKHADASNQQRDMQMLAQSHAARLLTAAQHNINYWHSHLHFDTCAQTKLTVCCDKRCFTNSVLQITTLATITLHHNAPKKHTQPPQRNNAIRSMSMHEQVQFTKAGSELHSVFNISWLLIKPWISLGCPSSLQFELLLDRIHAFLAILISNR